MNKIRRVTLFSIAGVLSIILVKIIIDIPYWMQIPALSELKVSSIPIQEQLSAASRRAYLNPSADNLGSLGMAYHSSSFYEQASICYKLAVKKNSSKWVWSYYLGYLNREMGNSENAIANFRTVTKENPKAFHGWYYLGEAYQKIGKNDNAEIAFEKIGLWVGEKQGAKSSSRIDYFPLNYYAKCQLARIYQNTNRTESAEKILNEIVQQNKSFGLAYRLLGSVSRIKGDSLSSKMYIVRANDLLNLGSPVDTLLDQIALQSRSSSYLLKQIDEADMGRYVDLESRLVKQGLKFMTDDKYLISKAIILYLKTNEAKQSLPLLRQHFQLFNNDLNELTHVANLLYEKKYFAQSGLYYERVLELQPDDTDIQVSLVLGTFYMGQEQKAIDLMEEYTKNESENPKVIANAVVELLAMSKFEKAEFYLEKLKHLSPSGSKTLLLSGKIAQQKGNIQEAQKLYESAFNKNPEDILCMKALSDILMRQKLWSSAIIHFKKAMVYFPNEPYVLEILGTLLVVCPDKELRNYEEGKEYLERAFFHKDCPIETMISSGKSLAHAYADLGDERTAAAYLKLTTDLAKNLNLPQEYIDKLNKKP